MDLMTLAIGLAIGLFVGASGYRYMLKRNPDKLEEWARIIREKTH